MPYTQENRPMSIQTPLGKDVLLLAGLTGEEGFPPFQLRIDLLSENHSVSFDQIIGKAVTVSIDLLMGRKAFQRIISRFLQPAEGRPARISTLYYRATMTPMPGCSRKPRIPGFPGPLRAEIFRNLPGKGTHGFQAQLQESYRKRATASSIWKPISTLSPPDGGRGHLLLFRAR